MRRAEPHLVLLLLARRCRARRLRLVERLLDRLGPLLHLREKRLVEQALEDEQQDEEVDALDDQRLVETDETALVPAFAGRPRGGRREEHQEKRQKDNEAREGADRFSVTLTHFGGLLDLSRCQTKVCENYHAIAFSVNRPRAQCEADLVITPPPITTSPL